MDPYCVWARPSKKGALLMNALMQYLIQKMKAKKEHWEKDDEHTFIIYLGFAAVIVCAIIMIVGSGYGN